MMNDGENQHMIHSQSVPVLQLSGFRRSVNRSHSDSEWKEAWKGAVLKAKEAKDPWVKYNIQETCKTEKALRYRFNALNRQWVRDEIEVKMQPESFGQGSMRKCFRLKKLSTFSHSKDWSHASNYVAKCYIDDISNKTYFDDVKIQMDAKVWAEEYNRQKPPKKVDIFQVYIIELVERENSPLFHVEHFIEGNYVKYNSNSGFVLADESFRMTPQAFSHFSFERSGHQLIVVDIQGVGDLYTDPQIHTACSTGYGEANLGTKGMALFFASHKCNKICEELGLAPFDLSPLEERRIDEVLSSSEPSTKLRDTFYIGKRKMSAVFDLVERLSDHASNSSSNPESPRSGRSIDDDDSDSDSHSLAESVVSGSSYQEYNSAEVDSYFAKYCHKKACVHPYNVLDENNFKQNFWKNSTRKRSCELDDVFEENHERNDADYESLQDTVLGTVHLELTHYNEIGRFSDMIPDTDSALFHLEHAASCGLVEANRELAKIYLQLPRNILENHIEMENDFNYNKGMTYLLNAANDSDLDAILIAARAFDQGTTLGTRDRSWPEALHWYEKALEISGTDFDGLSEHPHHKLYARMAKMYQEGGFGLERDLNKSGELYNEAAEAAMNIMQGKMANKYYILAEEVWAELD